jgi:hypothetical protein
MNETIEQLEEKKRRLELEREIAKLERTQRAGSFASRIPKWLAFPLAVLGIIFLFGATVEHSPAPFILFGLILLAPLAIRLIFARNSVDTRRH